MRRRRHGEQTASDGRRPRRDVRPKRLTVSLWKSVRVQELRLSHSTLVRCEFRLLTTVISNAILTSRNDDLPVVFEIRAPLMPNDRLITPVPSAVWTTSKYVMGRRGLKRCWILLSMTLQDDLS
ncbi:hypothetical protein EVAR_96095_1 [Eumeta japonica]|uniref:Uncharacterized protein n=1 Tax=Eumeta variegata TaxID=151549 RepID=A0A4C1VE17_EUMVA|nr:hypothetical protein EVAR_96095_1 [Eumeta japonica]